MKRAAALSFSLLLFTTSCVPFASSVDPIYVSTLTYDRWDCAKLEAENSRLSSEVVRLEGVQNTNAIADTAMTTVGILVAWPVLFGLAATHDHRVQLASAKGQLAAASQARTSGLCVAGTDDPEHQTAARHPPSGADGIPSPNSETPEPYIPAVAQAYAARSSGTVVADLIVARDSYRSCLSTIRQLPEYRPILSRLGDIKTGEVRSASSAENLPTDREGALYQAYWRSSRVCRADFEGATRRSSPAVANSVEKYNRRIDHTVDALVAGKTSWADAAREQNTAQKTLKTELQNISF